MRTKTAAPLREVRTRCRGKRKLCLSNGRVFGGYVVQLRFQLLALQSSRGCLGWFGWADVGRIFPNSERQCLLRTYLVHSRSHEQAFRCVVPSGGSRFRPHSESLLRAAFLSGVLFKVFEARGSRFELRSLEVSKFRSKSCVVFSPMRCHT